MCRSRGPCRRWLLPQENSTPNLSVLQQQTFISHLQVSGPAVARSGSSLPHFASHAGMWVHGRRLAGCVFTHKGRSSKAHVKPLSRRENCHMYSHSALGQDRLCTHSTACIWTTADVNHLLVREESQFLRILHCPIGGTTPVRFDFLLRFAALFGFASVLPSKETDRSNGNPRSIWNEGTSVMRWITIFQIFP